MRAVHSRPPRLVEGDGGRLASRAYRCEPVTKTAAALRVSVSTRAPGAARAAPAAAARHAAQPAACVRPVLTHVMSRDWSVVRPRRCDLAVHLHPGDQLASRARCPGSLATAAVARCAARRAEEHRRSPPRASGSRSTLRPLADRLLGAHAGSATEASADRRPRRATRHDRVAAHQDLAAGDAHVTLDPELARRLDGVVPTASFGDLLSA